MAEQTRQPTAGPAGLVAQLLTPLIDIVSLAGYFFLVPLLVKRLSAEDGWNLLLIFAAYVLMCAGVFIGRYLALSPTAKPAPRPEDTAASAGISSQDKPESDARGCALATAFPFSIFVCVMLGTATGWLGTRASDFYAAHTTLSITMASLAFIFVTGLFPAVVFMGRRPRLAYGSAAHLGVRALAVMLINFMVLLTTAFWEWWLIEAEPIDVALGGKILIWACVYVVFLMFYAPPRVALLAIEPNRWGFAGFLVFLAVIVWRMAFVA